MQWADALATPWQQVPIYHRVNDSNHARRETGDYGQPKSDMRAASRVEEEVDSSLP